MQSFKYIVTKEKVKIFYKAFQVKFFNQMDIETDNYEDIYCADDGEYRVYCNICDNLCMERF